MSNSSSTNPSRTSTPNPRFTNQSSTAEDLLKSQTVGLVPLSDFRKRRAEALEQKEREAQDRSLGRFTPGTSTPQSNGSDVSGASTTKTREEEAANRSKKRKKVVKKGGLSFGNDEDEEETDTGSMARKSHSETNSTTATPRSTTPGELSDDPAAPLKRRLGPNASVSMAPKALTKSALLKEAATRESLRREFLNIQEAIKGTTIAVPFVFYDGTNIPGGVCKIKKGDHVWLFLDKSRKVGAELGVGGEKAKASREWARVGVDDLMLVRGEIIVPHHYEFYYFIINKTKGPNGKPLFDYSTQVPESATPKSPQDTAVLTTLADRKKAAAKEMELEEGLEGSDDDAAYTKVVDRRWYEKNKHIFPASTWEEFDPEKDYSKAIRRDVGGNAFFSHKRSSREAMIRVRRRFSTTNRIKR